MPNSIKNEKKKQRFNFCPIPGMTQIIFLVVPLMLNAIIENFNL